MSLSVYLRQPGTKNIHGGIPSRRDGKTTTITRAEWDAINPGVEPLQLEDSESDVVFTANITHNLGQMADLVGLYQHLWCPDEINITTAKQLIAPLMVGRDKLLANRAECEKLNPDNGWGNYEGLLQFVTSYLAACIKYSSSTIEISR